MSGIGGSTLVISMPIEVGAHVWALLALTALWRLPAWVDRWLDVRDRWKGPRR